MNSLLPHKPARKEEAQRNVDNKLKSVVKEGNTVAFKYLVNKFSAPMFGLIKKIVHDKVIAEEVLRYTFLKIREEIDSYNPQHERLFTWMIKVMKNTALVYISVKSMPVEKKNNQKPSRIENETPAKGTNSINPSSFLHLILPSYRVVWELSVLRGYSNEEIANLLNLTPGAIQTRLKLACSALLSVMKV